MARQVKTTGRRRWLAGTTALTSGMLALTGAALANPQGGTVVSGSAIIAPKSNEVDVTLQSNRAIINWTGFNVAKGETIKFLGNPGGAVLNEVVGGNGASSIYGTISANGLLFALSNPQGIFFGQTAQVNAASVILTTATIAHNDFMAGNYKFSTPGNAQAAVVNQGTITVEEAGIAALVAPGVANSGVINARLSKVALASANTFYLDLYGDQLVSVAADKVMTTAVDANGNPLAAAVDHSGKIMADGGTVQITANVARSMVSSAINLSGVVQAQAVSEKGGTILLDGGDGIINIAGSGLIDATGKGAGQSGGTVSIAGAGLVHNGTIDVSGAVNGGQVAINTHDVLQGGTIRADGAEGQGGAVLASFAGFYLATQGSAMSAQGGSQGGTISVAGGSGSGLVLSGSANAGSAAGMGGQVALDATAINLLAASVDVSGATGGGSIAVGGGPHNGGAMAANTVNVNASSTLSADALSNGNGGSISLWSEQATNVMGQLSARGGAAGGNAGAVDVSADPAVKSSSVSLGSVPDLSAPHGEAGSVLIDPGTITVDATTGTPPFFQLINPDPNAATDGSRFGAWVRTLANGNILVTDPIVPMFGNSAAGAVYLFDGKTGGLISTLVGAGANNAAGINGVGVTTNGNAVVFSASPLGEATFINGTTGLNGVISASNTYIGNGAAGLTALGGTPVPCLTGQPALPASVCASILENILTNNPTSSPLNAAGANTTLGLPPFTNMTINIIGFVPLPNGNYELINTLGGTIAFGNGTTGISGNASSANSLTNTFVPDFPGPGGILSPCLQVPAACGLPAGAVPTVLTNGNVVVSSALGATFFNLNGGAVVADNSITAVNTLLGAGTVTALKNGNYVVDTPGALGNLGAITFGSGTIGIAGAITAANSLTGAAAGDLNGSVIDALNSGNYAVIAPDFGGTKGAVTLANGNGGTVGAITAGNSLIGANAGDSIGSGGILEAANGNIAVLSPSFAGNKGAATIIDATVGTRGIVSQANSMIGANAGDRIGGDGGAVLTNGDFVIDSPTFAGNSGAATFMTVGTAGIVSSTNSLIGNPGDAVGSGGILALANGNYTVDSPNWNGGLGAVTLGNGTTGTSGFLSAANSLTGSAATDHVGNGRVVALGNGNFVVVSPNWNANTGAVTLGNGTTGTFGATGAFGAVSSANSLVGAAPGAQLGAQIPNFNNTSGGLTANMELLNPMPVTNVPPPPPVVTPVFAVGSGNYIVVSANAVTFGNGTTGVVGTINSANSLMGPGVGQGGTYVLPNGNYVVASPFFGNDQGAVTFGSGAAGTVGAINSANSLIGNPGDLLGFSILSIPLTGQPGNPALTSAAIYQTLFAQGKLSVPGVGPTVADLAVFGLPNGFPVVGSIAFTSNGDYIIGSPFSFGGKGSVTFGSGKIGVTGMLSAQTSIIGNGEAFGTYIQDDAPLGTFVASGMIGGQTATSGGPVFVSAGVPKGFDTVLNGMLAQANVTLSPQSIHTALGNGDRLTLQASGNIVFDSPVNLGSGNLFLIAGDQIRFNNGLALDTTFSGAPGSELGFFSSTTNGGVASAILGMTDNDREPARNLVANAYAPPPGPYCVSFTSGGECEAPKTPEQALAARGNAFLGNLAYRPGH